ncbi:facilitated trehalose transporter Tret1-like [Drosophila mojavensis]|uniref:facilitated trehalose transporter Tret1-like n=1 Tax=Drosophila mojavensis TaxID=7230 RepID=UPI001CD14087|nr:facilitated trehalose transporter Tret1-like [Drosophila mojavensis]
MGIKKQYIAGSIGSLGGLCLGMVLGWSGPAQMLIAKGKGYKRFKPSDAEFSWMAALVPLGAACTCLPVGFLAGVCGRKMVMLAVVIPLLLGWILITTATHVIMAQVGRFLTGASVGVYTILVPIYNTEISEVATRGLMGCFYQLWLTIGILISYIVGGYVSLLVFNIFSTIIPAVYFLLFIWMPESPAYYVQKGKLDKAEKIIYWLRGKNVDISADLSAMAAEAKKEKVNMHDGMCRKTTRKGLGISITLLALQQFCGINAIAFYTTKLFEDAGAGIASEVCTIIIGIVGCVAVIPSILFIDRGGRRIFLFVAAAIMCVSHFLMGVYFHWLMRKHVDWLPIVVVCIFVFAFSMAFGPVPWLIMAELFAEDVKPLCGAIVGTLTWIFGFLVTILFPICLEHMGPAATFWTFSAIALLAFLFIFVVPETKAKTLDQIQAELQGKPKN